MNSSHNKYCLISHQFSGNPLHDYPFHVSTDLKTNVMNLFKSSIKYTFINDCPVLECLQTPVH